MRMTRKGAAWSAQSSQTPSAASAVTEPASRAVVRLSFAAGPLADQHCLDAARGKRDRGGKARRPAADHNGA